MTLADDLRDLTDRVERRLASSVPLDDGERDALAGALHALEALLDGPDDGE